MSDVTNPDFVAYRFEGDPVPPSSRMYVVQDDGSLVEELPVILPPGMRNSVAFVYGRNQRGEMLVQGTAFIVNVRVGGTQYGFLHVVTARHVLEKIRRFSNDDLVWLRVNTDDGVSSDYFGIPFSRWFFHPLDNSDLVGDEWLEEATERTRYDVAVTGAPHALYDLESLTALNASLLMDDSAVQADRVDAGDDIFVIGLYHQHVGSARNVPVVRTGTVAAVPPDLVKTGLGPMKAYLMETRSTGGLSGSPVVWWSGSHRPGEKLGDWRPVERGYIGVLGLIQGHYDTRIDMEKLNDGIAIIVPASTILETISQEGLVAARKDAEERFRRTTSGPSSDSVPDETPEGDRVSLAGVDPEDALRALLRTPPHGQNQDPA